MRLTGVIAFLAAAACHALLLFGFRAGDVAQPLPLGETPQAVDVALVGSAPPSAPEPAPPEPAAAVEQPQPEPTPAPAPVLTEPPVPQQESSPTAPLPESLPTPKPEPVVSPRKSPQEQPQPAKPRASNPTAQTAAPVPQASPKRSIVSQWFRCLDAGSGGGSQGARPRYRSNPAPNYPEEARRNGQQGVVLISAEVGPDGRPSNVTLKQSSGFSLLDAAALEAVKKWAFEPSRVAGMAVSSRVDLPVRFTLENR